MLKLCVNWSFLFAVFRSHVSVRPTPPTSSMRPALVVVNVLLRFFVFFFTTGSDASPEVCLCVKYVHFVRARLIMPPSPTRYRPTKSGRVGHFRPSPSHFYKGRARSPTVPGTAAASEVDTDMPAPAARLGITRHVARQSADIARACTVGTLEHLASKACESVQTQRDTVNHTDTNGP